MTPHAEYRNSVIDRLRSLGSNLVTATRLWALQDLAILAWTANLDTIGFILRRGYSGIGRPPRDPAAMFRAWILATSLGISSPTKWADRLSTDPVLAILCGFEPTDTPSATTFVDFMTRLTRTMRARARVHCPHRKRGKGPGKGKKRPLRRADVLARLQAQLPRFGHGDEGPLQEILATIAAGSADRGLVDLNQLRIAGDSTVLPAAANSFGRRMCDCPPGTPCGHRRRFSDGDATWGWDSSRGIWIYGHRFYEITAAGCAHDLPLLIRSVGADRHDAVSWLLSYSDFGSYYPDAHIIAAILDSAHDAGVLFDQLHRGNIQAIIDLNPAHNPKHPVRLTADGLPICCCGHPMSPDGSSRGRRKYVCPRTRKRSAPDDQPPCSHIVYISGTAAFRLHPGIARGTEAWRLAYNDRTCTERSHTRKRNDFGQLRNRRRGRRNRTAHYFFAAYCQHFAAWVQNAAVRFETVFAELIEPHMPVLLTLPRHAAA